MVGLKLLLVLAFMTVFKPSAQGEIELVIISENLTIDAGKSALLVCVGFDTDNISVDISWSRNGETIRNSSSSIPTSQDVVHRNKLFRQSFLQLCGAQHLESGNYRCSVRNETSSVSSSVEVIINDVLEMVIISNSSVVSVGDSVLLVCMGFGQPSINFSWSKGGIIEDSSDMLTEEDMELGGRLYRLSRLKICSIQTCHSGNYNCSISNGISVVTASVEVMVEGNSLSITSILNETTIIAGDPMELTCIAQPGNFVHISWSYSGNTVARSEGVSIVDEIDQMGLGGGKKSVLRYRMMRSEDSGTYMCIVSNECDSDRSEVEVSVQNVLEVTIFSNMSNVSVGDTILLVCMGFGHPSINFTWSKGGEEIIEDSSHMLTEEDMELGGRLYQQSLLRICSIQTCHSGDYNCSITNGTSVVTTSVEVVVEGNSLSITSISNKTTITSGDPVELTCVGQPGNFVNISWSYNGKTVTSSEGVSIVDEIDQIGSGGGKKSILRYRMMTTGESGMHMCVVSNECSSDRSEVEVSVQTFIMAPSGGSSGFSTTNIQIVTAVAAGMFAVLIISSLVIVIYCVIKHKKNTSTLYPSTCNSEEDYIYIDITKGTALSKDYNNAKSSDNNAKSSDKDELYENPMPSPGRTSHNDYKKPASFPMTKINDAYGVVNNNNSGNFPEMDANPAYESIQTGYGDVVEDDIHSSADEL